MPVALKPDDAVVVAYKRTAFGRARKGSFADERPEDLALAAVRGVLADVPALDPATLDDFYLGRRCRRARRATTSPGGSRYTRVTTHFPAATVNRFCASSLQATAAAARAIRAGDGDAFLVGGMESTSSTPRFPHDIYPGSDISAARVDGSSHRMGEWTDPRDVGARPDVYIAMGKTAELVARLTGTSRRDQDEWALQSQLRAAAAIDSGYFAREILPYTRARRQRHRGRRRPAHRHHAGGARRAEPSRSARAVP